MQFRKVCFLLDQILPSQNIICCVHLLFNTDLEDQKKIAELFNTTLKISPLAEDRDKALNDIVRRVKEDSIEQQMNATNDILRWQDLIKEKANLAKLHISL